MRAVNDEDVSYTPEVISNRLFRTYEIPFDKEKSVEDTIHEAFHDVSVIRAPGFGSSVVEEDGTMWNVFTDYLEGKITLRNVEHVEGI